MATETVECVRCRASVPSNQADFSADGMLCRNCAVSVDVAGRLGVSSTGAPDVLAMQRDFARGRAKKHVIIGLGAVVLGIVALMVTGSNGNVVIIPGGLLVGGVVELGRGMSGLSANPA